jgi:hypothetical protein
MHGACQKLVPQGRSRCSRDGSRTSRRQAPSHCLPCRKAPRRWATCLLLDVGRCSDHSARCNRCTSHRYLPTTRQSCRASRPFPLHTAEGRWRRYSRPLSSRRDRRTPTRLPLAGGSLCSLYSLSLCNSVQTAAAVKVSAEASFSTESGRSMRNLRCMGTGRSYHSLAFLTLSGPNDAFGIDHWGAFRPYERRAVRC